MGVTSKICRVLIVAGNRQQASQAICLTPQLEFILASQSVHADLPMLLWKGM